MSGIGIICDLQYERHHLFKSYFHTVENIIESPRIVLNIDDLLGVKLLFIGDTHYSEHNKIWKDKAFIDYCNINKIKVVALDNEKILNSYFPGNVDNLKWLKQFRYLYHYTNDVDDCIALGLRLNKTAPSIYFKPVFDKYVNNEKVNKVVFIGKVKCKSYSTRRSVMRYVCSKIPVDIIESNIPSWDDYLKTISGYKFILSPLGNGNFFPMRFYEALAVGSIPIHQVYDNTLNLYDVEATYKDCLFFKTNDIFKKFLNFDSQITVENRLWMEDNLKQLLTLDKII